MFAHVHDTDGAYFSHAGKWVQLADLSRVEDLSFAVDAGAGGGGSSEDISINSAAITFLTGLLYDLSLSLDSQVNDLSLSVDSEINDLSLSVDSQINDLSLSVDSQINDLSLSVDDAFANFSGGGGGGGGLTAYVDSDSSDKATWRSSIKDALKDMSGTLELRNLDHFIIGPNTENSISTAKLYLRNIQTDKTESNAAANPPASELYLNSYYNYVGSHANGHVWLKGERIYMYPWGGSTWVNKIYAMRPIALSVVGGTYSTGLGTRSGNYSLSLYNTNLMAQNIYSSWDDD